MSNEESIENEAGKTEPQPNSANNNSENHGATNSTNSSALFEQIQAGQHGFDPSSVNTQSPAPSEPIISLLAQQPATLYAQMLELEGGNGSILYYPKEVEFDVGDVLYLRERDYGENGLIAQVVEKSTANYAQAASKALFRLMASVRAYQLQRSHNEPPETIDQFLSLQFKVRAAIVNGHWCPHEGRVVTRNVDIFQISPQVLIQNIILTEQ